MSDAVSYEQALDEGAGVLEERTTSDPEPGENLDTGMSFVDALTQFATIMADLKKVGNPALTALTARHPDDDEDDEVFSPAFKAKCRALLAARDYAGMLDSLAKKAKEDRDELELEVFDIFDRMSSDDDSKVTGTIPVPLGAPYGTVKFKARATHYAKIVDDEKLQEYLENRALVDGYVEPKFSKAKLHTMVREIMEKPDGKLPPGLTYTTDRGMTITRPK